VYCRSRVSADNRPTVQQQQQVQYLNMADGGVVGYGAVDAPNYDSAPPIITGEVTRAVGRIGTKRILTYTAKTVLLYPSCCCSGFDSCM